MSGDQQVNRGYSFGAGLTRPAFAQPYDVPSNEPACWRNLRVFALDPSVSRLEGAVATLRVPFEANLTKGPAGQLFRVDMSVDKSDTVYDPLDVNDPSMLRTAGRWPDEADAGFHAQMVYAIASLTYESFRSALGRHTTWAFNGGDHGQAQPLSLYPFGLQGQKNAYYSRRERAVRFGFFMSEDNSNRRLPGSYLFTALSSDIVTHEVTHALLDGLKPYFIEPTNVEIPAFHEAFADLIAVFQRFTFEEMVHAQMRRARGRLDGPTLLRMLAPEFGTELGHGGGLRTFEPALSSAIKADSERAHEQPAREIVSMSDLYARNKIEPHELGRVLAEAIFDAFATIVHRKTFPFIGLATNGTGVLPDGDIPIALLNEIVHVTRRVAAQFRAICIRAIDYCPPVHLEFGDYLRALITADRELVRDDPHGYREAIVKACVMRGIYPKRDVPTPSETSLMWHGPERDVGVIEGLGLSELNFKGDPTIPANATEIQRQARILGNRIVSSTGLLAEFGLVPPGDGYDVPEIVSMRSARRVGPDGQVSFDLVAEVVQSCEIMVKGHRIKLRGGATIILGPLGQIRFVIRKRIDSAVRREQITTFLQSEGGERYLGAYGEDGGDVFKQLCYRKECAD